jgi:hypothetical protein
LKVLFVVKCSKIFSDCETLGHTEAIVTVRACQRVGNELVVTLGLERVVRRLLQARRA